MGTESEPSAAADRDSVKTPFSPATRYRERFRRSVEGAVSNMQHAVSFIFSDMNKSIKSKSLLRNCILIPVPLAAFMIILLAASILLRDNPYAAFQFHDSWFFVVMMVVNGLGLTFAEEFVLPFDQFLAQQFPLIAVLGYAFFIALPWLFVGFLISLWRSK